MAHNITVCFLSTSACNFFFLRQGFSYVDLATTHHVQPTGLKLRSISLCLPCAGNKGIVPSSGKHVSFHIKNKLPSQPLHYTLIEKEMQEKKIIGYNIISKTGWLQNPSSPVWVCADANSDTTNLSNLQDTRKVMEKPAR